MAINLKISPAESGQRLLRFLERKLDCPRPMLYRWMRSGQVRVNGGRAKPEYAIHAGDVLRLPPHAEDMLRDKSDCGIIQDKSPSEIKLIIGAGDNQQQGQEALSLTGSARNQGNDPLPVEPSSQPVRNIKKHSNECRLDSSLLGADLGIVYQDEDLLVLNKPSGLAVQGGTGQADSVADRLRKACSPPYVPAPAHRLDLHASGLLACGKSYLAQAWLHELFRNSKPELHRSYLCWVKGDAAKLLLLATELADVLIQTKGQDGRERMAVRVSENGQQISKAGGKEARARYECLEVREHPKLGKISLLQAELLTGRKHQIRVQLASRGFPLIGDGRYGGPTGYPFMLHAWRLALPDHDGRQALDLRLFPEWADPYACPPTCN